VIARLQALVRVRDGGDPFARFVADALQLGNNAPCWRDAVSTSVGGSDEAAGRQSAGLEHRNVAAIGRLELGMTDLIASGPLKVDIWSDVACPWCYIGKRRFEEGVRRYQDAGGERTVDVLYHSFELAPDTPVDFQGSEIDFLAQYKGMPADQVRQMLAQMTETAAAVGLAYDFDALKHTKTVKAHQVLHLAKAHGVQLEMKERLLRAYFVQGRHIGHDDSLADLAAEVGLPRQLVLDALRAGTYALDVQADIRQAQSYGISGVPFFVLDERYGVSGAQPPELFAQALAKAAAG
jgi:predicted DsbA family dithiol-disulfide isomerase